MTQGAVSSRAIETKSVRPARRTRRSFQSRFSDARLQIKCPRGGPSEEFWIDFDLPRPNVESCTFMSFDMLISLGKRPRVQENLILDRFRKTGAMPTYCY